MWNSINRYYQSHPLRSILLVGLLFRLLAVIFSKGYAFTDDHYFVIEEAQQWIFQSNEPRSFFNPNIILEERLSHGALYTSLHYVLFQIYRLIGFDDPMNIMLSVRFMHALYSLWIVFLGYKIARHWGSPKTALQIAWILALAWFMPFLSVRNLVEVVCIPPLMGATLLFLKHNKKAFFGAGLLAALAFSLRFQTVLFSGMFGLILLWQLRWRDAIALLLGFGIGSVVLLGGLDFLLFGTPFYELISYVAYNATHAGEYPNGPWYQYIGVILGMFLIFPAANWLMASALKFRTYAVLLFPTLVFLLFHSYFPNKQERFILPVIPFLIMAGILAWNQYVEFKKSDKINRWNRFSMKFFWILNTPLLFGLSLASTRTAKMEAMYFLYQQRDATHFAIESTHRDYMEFMPRFYGNFWSRYQHILPNCEAPCFFDSVAHGVHPFPNYILFFDEDNLNERVAKVQTVVDIDYLETIESSWLDQLIPKLNPIVKSQKIFVYKVKGILEGRLPASSGTTSVKAATAAETTESS